MKKTGRIRKARLPRIRGDVVRSVCLLAGCLVISLSSCSRKPELPAATDETGGPVQIVEDSKLQLFDGARKVWVLESKRMRKSLGDTGSVVGYPVKLTMYDSSGATSTICLADSGSTNERKDAFRVWGNVYVKNPDGQIIRARRLNWDGNRHTVDSDDFVEVKTPTGDIIRGKGLDADEKFTRWTLRQQASGQFPNFRQRMESEDGFSAEPEKTRRRAPAPDRVSGTIDFSADTGAQMNTETPDSGGEE